MQKQKVFYTEQFKSGNNKTFFFDLKQSEQGNPYLVITESRKNDDGDYSRQRIVLFGEELQRFGETFLRSMIRFPWKSNQPSEDHIEKIRLKYPNAYTTWIPEDDQLLQEKIRQGMSIEEAASFFQRPSGAIHKRLEKLGVLAESKN